MEKFNIKTSSTQDDYRTPASVKYEKIYSLGSNIVNR